VSDRGLVRRIEIRRDRKKIAATVIGGANLAGGVCAAFGALAGSALLEIISNSPGLLGINAFWQGAFVGAFILVTLKFDRIRNFRQEE
jgi:ribose transport system permease protein